VQLEREAVTAGFEGVAMRFLALEESPIVLVNEACRAGRRQGQPRGRVRCSTRQTECFWAHDSFIGGLCLALPRKWRVMSLMGVASGRWITTFPDSRADSASAPGPLR